MELLEKLRAMKAKSGLSMREIAEMSGVPEATLEKIFAGLTKNPGVATIQKIVHCLGYTLDDLDPSGKPKEKRASFLTNEAQMLLIAFDEAPDNVQEAIRLLLNI